MNESMAVRDAKNAETQARGVIARMARIAFSNPYARTEDFDVFYDTLNRHACAVERRVRVEMAEATGDSKASRIMQRVVYFDGRPYTAQEVPEAQIKAVASLLDREALLRLAEGPCGPTEIVEAE